MKITINRLVHYRLTAADVARVEVLRQEAGGALNPHHVDQVLPLLVCVVWPNEYGENFDGVNGQVFLDGNRTLWVTSVKEGREPGTWAFPPMLGDMSAFTADKG